MLFRSPVMAAVVMEDFQRINEELNISIIINIHHVDLALKYAQRIVGIQAGKIVYDGKVSDINNDILKKIYGRELSEDELMEKKNAKLD